jgi:hypothetical protein
LFEENERRENELEWRNDSLGHKRHLTTSWRHDQIVNCSKIDGGAVFSSSSAQTEKQTSCSRRNVTSKDIIYANRYIKFESNYVIFASKDMLLDDLNIEPGDSKML